MVGWPVLSSSHRHPAEARDGRHGRWVLVAALPSLAIAATVLVSSPSLVGHTGHDGPPPHAQTSPSWGHWINHHRRLPAVCPGKGRVPGCACRARDHRSRRGRASSAPRGGLARHCGRGASGTGQDCGDRLHARRSHRPARCRATAGAVDRRPVSDARGAIGALRISAMGGRQDGLSHTGCITASLMTAQFSLSTD
jgi:hypothetical protein